MTSSVQPLGTAPTTTTADTNATNQSTPTRFIDSFADFLFNPPTPPQTLSAKVNKQGQAIVTTEDGYTITFEGKHEAFTITGPDGKTTRIWGDPHVDESDGDRWDFKNQSSFIFGNNKITVETIKRPGYEVTFSKTVTIYNGEDRFTLTGIDTNKPKLVGWKLDGGNHDVGLDDGDVYRLEREGDDERWVKVEPDKQS